MSDQSNFLAMAMHRLRRRIVWIDRVMFLALLSIGARVLFLIQLGMSGSRAAEVGALAPGVIVALGAMGFVFEVDMRAASMNHTAIQRRAESMPVVAIPQRIWFAVMMLWLACVPELVAFALWQNSGVYAAFFTLALCEGVSVVFLVIAFASHRAHRPGFGLLLRAKTGEGAGQVVWRALAEEGRAPEHFRVGAIVFRDGGVRLPFAPTRALTIPETSPEDLVVFFGGVPVRAAGVKAT